MSIDANVPTDSEFLSALAAYIRETREEMNTLVSIILESRFPDLATIANADTSPSVGGAVVLVTANTGNTKITFFNDGYEGQFICIVAGDAYTSIQHSTGLIELTSLADIKLNLGEAICLCYQNSKWHEVGGYKRTSMKDITDASYLILVSDIALKCNAGSSAITLTLPLASSVSMGHTIKVKKTDSTANVISIIRTSPDTLNDLTTAVELTLQNESISFVSDGVSDWTTFN